MHVWIKMGMKRENFEKLSCRIQIPEDKFCRQASRASFTGKACKNISWESAYLIGKSPAHVIGPAHMRTSPIRSPLTNYFSDKHPLTSTTPSCHLAFTSHARSTILLINNYSPLYVIQQTTLLQFCIFKSSLLLILSFPSATQKEELESERESPRVRKEELWATVVSSTTSSLLLSSSLFPQMVSFDLTLPFFSLNANAPYNNLFSSLLRSNTDKIYIFY